MIEEFKKLILEGRGVDFLDVVSETLDQKALEVYNDVMLDVAPTMLEDVEQIDEISDRYLRDYKRIQAKRAADPASTPEEREIARNKHTKAASRKVTPTGFLGMGKPKVTYESVSEDVEQIDELSTDTLKSYAKKAGLQAKIRNSMYGTYARMADKEDNYDKSKYWESRAAKNKRIADKRRDGYDAAIDSLSDKGVRESYGDKRDYPKRHIHVDGEYVATTNWARTNKEARDKFLEKYPQHASKKVTIIKEDLNEEMSDAAHELVLHADNDRILHRSSHEPIIANLKKKVANGTYDHEKAKKLWGYHADRAAQSYHKQFGSPGTKWHQMFSTADRKQAAAHFADHAREEYLKEDIEQIDELSRDTLARYSKKANDYIDRYDLPSNMGATSKEIDKKLNRRIKTVSKLKEDIEIFENYIDYLASLSESQIDEELSQLDEISKKKLGAYMKAAKTDLRNAEYHGGSLGARFTDASVKARNTKIPSIKSSLEKRADMYHDEREEKYAKAIKRNRGLDTAIAKLTGDAKVPAKNPVGRPRKVAEEVEQIDELSKEALGRYAKAARRAGLYHAGASSAESQYMRDALDKKDYDRAKFHKKRMDNQTFKAMKREIGHDLAVDKLTGSAKVNANEDFEQIEELSKDTLGSYIIKASVDKTKKSDEYNAASKRRFNTRNPSSLTRDAEYGETEQDFAKRKERLAKRRTDLTNVMDKSQKTIAKRNSGITIASRKYDKE